MSYSYGKILGGIFENETPYYRTWHCCVVRPDEISVDWLQDNIRSDYTAFGYYWYFEDADDATLFRLTWAE